ncbi:transient receptor potential channel pyrexia-like [Sitophilus oryzae]|uniref:Transient receptor potential channel pyrexia-like n=1 Tax=Sitophilus oryzae TaxID=7048 RepID=A0A6J2X823_SITOR|nr:transient receptor potential channel pyrexia-like [Sitophilus oryzae]
MISRENLVFKLGGSTKSELNHALLWSAVEGKWDLFEGLLILGADIDYFDPNYGLSALHLSAFIGSVEATHFLIKRVNNINVVNKWYNPLHCATTAGQVETAKLLLDNGAKLNSLANGPSYETPLYIAVEKNAINCVELFVDRGAEIYQEGKLADMSPFFRAAQLGHWECLEIMLKSKTVNCREIRKIENGNFALHISAECGHPECVEVLLNAGVNPNLTNLSHKDFFCVDCVICVQTVVLTNIIYFRFQTALHLAVKTNSYSCVELLLNKGNVDPNLKDINEKTPLHSAVELVADSRRDIVNILLRYGADVNATDQHGFTPLHTAALNELSQTVSILISHGADISLKSKSGISAFGLVARKTPSAFSALRDKLAQHVTLSHDPESLNDVEIQFDFKSGLLHPREYALLNTFIDEGHKEMLLHPFCSAFLYVTWCRIGRCYYGMIYVSLIFSLCLLFYLLTALAYDCVEKESESCRNDSFLNRFLVESPYTLEIQWYVLLFSSLGLAYRKIYGFRGYPSVKDYLNNIGNVFEWIGIISVFPLSFLYTGKVEQWQIHLGPFALMFAWTNVMFLIGQLPIFGPYVEMFHKVLNEFFKLLLVFTSLLVGYTVSFCIYFPNSAAFSNPITGFITVLVMMTGDMNISLLLDYDKEQNSSFFSQLGARVMYTFFLVFVTIVLMNLLVGIAVHDIQGLQKNADLSRLVRQAQLSSYIEMSHYERSEIAKCVMTMLRVVPKPYIGILKVKPLDPTENRLPKVILQGAYELIKKRQKMEVFSRSLSDGAAWKKAFRKTDQNLKSRSSLNKICSKLENHFGRVDKLQKDMDDLRNLLKSIYLDKK